MGVNVEAESKPAINSKLIIVGVLTFLGGAITALVAALAMPPPINWLAVIVSCVGAGVGALVIWLRTQTSLPINGIMAPSDKP